MSDGVFRIYPTLAITWPQGVHSEEDVLVAAAQVHGNVIRQDMDDRISHESFSFNADRIRSAT